MTPQRDQLAIAELTAMLADEFDLSTVLDMVAHDARASFDASSAALVLLDVRDRTDDLGMQVVAEALPQSIDSDLGFLTAGPALASARDGAVTMVADLADASDTRWPSYRRDALRAGMRGVRAFPLILLGSSVGTLVIHTGDPWGTQRPNAVGQTLANLAAIAISIAPHLSQRRSDTQDTIESALQGTVTIATATGIIAEVSDLDAAEARLQLHRLARAHQATAGAYAERIVTAYNSDPVRFAASVLLAYPDVLPSPPHIHL
ncbi:Uncharacterised protein [Mycolicibacterium vanbaalenii]|uniref:GAF domain-containing protein n=1 Tax=Mycolicibacterium vanbaalenii TaxID=110539 RepID=A0A5S9R4Z8_MYCVN|nr:GAF and ANTAR domain-containing protein [Mycolicibacterium vanbaalenii]CAA0128322.1 Uncharacterised protein [Mycolicibacterium vanbaalenii]